ncbi:Phosphatidylinositol-glycan biosynthesis class S protein [Penicillium bovifimosum]|uniref:Phosphatidylinositol-glycan biosynthesis class S protein n=1 Tax=Penicillium bovifimosum TaxID=126998 RepID=A0A9W9GUD9_9EURO|nr:Phosphatidylinositol-glycan biosynthesis class S protein [Penicillium bovifimosum]KAJ5130244.1 Phosphatidylinositol-glycan biosynthesis class S protein [Penicillium bovifimosum]
MTTKTGDQESPLASQVDPQTSVSRVPPPETPAAVQTRFRVIAAFWAVIIFLGFPIWWKTTSIYRASLPLEEMVHWADGKTCRPVFPLEIHLSTPSLPYIEAQHLLRTTQHTLDDLNEFAAHHLRLKLANDTTGDHTGQDSSEHVNYAARETPDTALTVRLLPQEGLASPRSELHAATTQLDVFYPPSQIPVSSSSNSPLSTFIAAELQQLYGEEKATIAHILSGDTARLASTSPQLAEDISRRLRRSMKYAETYHLSFSLFTPGAEPSSWDIEAAVNEYVSPLLQALSPISNFTVDTQVQLYANFAPTAPKPEYDESEAVWTLKKEGLSAFVNAAEWPLNPSIGTGPTINFILYVPDPSQSPLVVKENSASSWIVPQWGGVFLLNPPLSNDEQGSRSNPAHLSLGSLGPAFMTFSHQLLTLLGTPSTPASLPLRLQTSIRIRAATLLLSASSTMGSLARLTESLPSIPIPATVATSVSTTLSHLTATCSHLREGRFGAALASARVAETEAERSFFEKSMVGQVYFPDEHKVAVYLPLLGPIGVPLVVGLLRELKRIAAKRKAKAS